MEYYFRNVVIGFCLCLFVLGCNKTNNGNAGSNPPAPKSLSYGDSVFYLANQSADYIVKPQVSATGTYSAFPDGLNLDQSTGVIDVSKSETGLKYRISFVPASGGDSIFTTVLISGINFLDGFYKLNTADSIAHPVYNANAKLSIPGLSNGSQFDEGAKCNSSGCTVNVGDGQINLAQTVRNGVFGATPTNNDRHEFDLDYRINDKSSKALNTIRVKLYYFDTMNDVTQEVYDIISSRVGTIIDANAPFTSNFPVIAVNSTNAVNGIATKSAKPRPPCIFIVSR